MELHLSGRGAVITPALRRYAEGKVAKLGRFLPKITEARLVLATERYQQRAEITLQTKGATLHAEAAAGEFHAAIDLAVDNLEQQARRRKERVVARKPRAARVSRRLPGPGPEGELAEDGPGLIVRRLTSKPMSVDEAVEQIRDRAQGFLVFVNARSRRLNVLHRRPDGQLELVQPGA